MDLDRIADEGNGHAKCQHYHNHQANAHSQADLDIPQYQSSRGQAISADHAITSMNLIFCHVAGNDRYNSSNKWYEKPGNNPRYQADDCQRTGGLGRG